MTALREDCEIACSADKACGGFAFTEATTLCEFTEVPSGSFRASGYCSGGGQVYADQYNTEDTLGEAVGTVFVEKVMAGFSVEQPWSPPCSAIVSTTGLYRLIWGGQAMFSADSNLIMLDDLTAYSRMCSGWVLEYLVDGEFSPMWATFQA